MVAQLGKYTKNHWSIHFQWVTLWNANFISITSTLWSQQWGLSHYLCEDYDRKHIVGTQLGYIKRISVAKVVIIKLGRNKTNPGLLVTKFRFLGPHLIDNESISLGEASRYKNYQGCSDESPASGSLSHHNTSVSLLDIPGTVPYTELLY